MQTTLCKSMQCIGVLKHIKHLLPQQARITLYSALILPVLDYANVVWVLLICQDYSEKICYSLIEPYFNCYSASTISGAT